MDRASAAYAAIKMQLDEMNAPYSVQSSTSVHDQSYQPDPAFHHDDDDNDDDGEDGGWNDSNVDNDGYSVAVHVGIIPLTVFVVVIIVVVVDLLVLLVLFVSGGLVGLGAFLREGWSVVCGYWTGVGI